MRTKIIIAIVLIVALRQLQASEPFQVQFNQVLDTLRSGTYGNVQLLTNQLEVLAASAPSVQDAANCRIIETCILLERAGSEVDEVAFSKATNLCAVVSGDMMDHTNSWQRYCIELARADAYTIDGKHAQAFSMKTNLLAAIETACCTNGDAVVWPALSCYLFESNSLSFHDAVRASAAMNKAIMHDAAGIGSYTNGLPNGVVSVIEEVLNANAAP